MNKIAIVSAYFLFTLGNVFASDPQFYYTRGATVEDGNVEERSDYQAFVWSLDRQFGQKFNSSTNNSELFNGTIPWFVRRSASNGGVKQFGGDFSAAQPWPIDAFVPLVGFGASVGKNPLYTNRTYSFGFYAGCGTATQIPIIRISAYAKASFENGVTSVQPLYVNEITVPVPPSVNSSAINVSEWEAYTASGFKKTYVDPTGLVNVLTVVSSSSTSPWGQWNLSNNATGYVLQQKASSADYYYVIELKGAVLNISNPAQAFPFAKATGVESDWAFLPLYTLDFVNPAPWQTSFLTKPIFEKTELPSAYQGKSLEQLLSVKPESFDLPNSLPQSTEDLNIFLQAARALNDNSPDTVIHPELNELADTLEADTPANTLLSISNYILNEISLTDGISGNLENSRQTGAIDLGGIKRGPLAVYLEGQGSPLEQCGLLIYLLRSKGIAAIYAKPPTGSLKMLDFEIGRLLHLQLAEGIDWSGKPLADTLTSASASSSRKLIPVNYPYVLAYVDSKWVPIFPWLADIQATEGIDISTVFSAPTSDGIATSWDWIKKYLNADVSVMNPLAKPQQPRNVPSILFPQYLEKRLSNGQQDVFDNVGTTFQTRKHYYSNVDDLPQPFLCEDQGSASIYKNFDELSPDGKLFDTVHIVIKYGGTALSDGDLGKMRFIDLHNRRFVIHQKRGAEISGAVLNSATTSNPTYGASNVFSDDTLLNGGQLPLEADPAADDDENSSDVPTTNDDEEGPDIPGEFVAVDPDEETPPLTLESTPDPEVEAEAIPSGEENGDPTFSPTDELPDAIVEPVRKREMMALTRTASGQASATATQASTTGTGTATKKVFYHHVWKNPDPLLVQVNTFKFGFEKNQQTISNGTTTLPVDIVINSCRIEGSGAGQFRRVQPQGVKQLPFTWKSGKTAKNLVAVKYLGTATGKHDANIILNITLKNNSANYSQRQEIILRRVHGETILPPKLGTLNSPELAVETSLNEARSESRLFKNLNRYPLTLGKAFDVVLKDYAQRPAGMNYGWAPSQLLGAKKEALFVLGTTAPNVGTFTDTAFVQIKYRKAWGIVRIPVRAKVVGAYAYEMDVTLSSARDGLGAEGNFSAGGDLLPAQRRRIILGEPNSRYSWEDFEIEYKVNQHRFAAANQISTLGAAETSEFIAKRPFRKGDLLALCINYGRVTQKMLNIHAQDFWKEKVVNQSQINDEKRNAIAVYLMGMGYYKNLSDSQDLLRRLFKISDFRSMGFGHSRFNAYRTAGRLPYGEIHYTDPMVDMFYRETKSLVNSAIHHETSVPNQTLLNDTLAMNIVSASAEEHNILNTFLGQKDAISTVRLLQIAAKQPTGIRILTKQSPSSAYPTGADFVNIKSDLLNKLAPTNANADYTVAFVTPEAVTGADGAYKGGGALLFSPTEQAAWITGNSVPLNGGYGGSVAKNTFDPGPVKFNINTTAGNFSLDMNSFGSGSLVAPYVVAPMNIRDITTTANRFTTSAFQNSWVQASSYTFDISASTKSFAKSAVEINNRGWLSSAVNSFSDTAKLVADPVNVVTGEFYHDEQDLKIDGPFQLAIRRNYSSRNLADNFFGYGWKLSMMPFLVLDGTTETGGHITAAEMDGSVIKYRALANGLYTPQPADNPYLTSVSGEVSSGETNMFNARIQRIDGANGTPTIYILSSPDGSQRKFTVRSYPLAGQARNRPYLDEWKDRNGNTAFFEYFDRSQDIDKPYYGQLRRIRTSSGNSIGFVYDVNAHVTQAYTGDGRRVIYTYDEYGDLRSVLRPDGTTVRYEYSLKDNSGKLEPEHLLIRDTKPGGRVVENVYDSKRRVWKQFATVDDENPSKLVLNATFDYANNDSSTDGSVPEGGLTGTTTITDVNEKLWKYEYTSGRLEKITEPGQNPTLREFYPSTAEKGEDGAFPNALKKTTDKRGLVTFYKYDAKADVRKITVTGNLSGEDQANESYTIDKTYSDQHQVKTVSNSANSIDIEHKYENPAFPYLPTEILRKVNGTVISKTTRTYGSVGSENLLFAKGLLKTETITTIAANGPKTESFNEWDYDGRGYLKKKIEHAGNNAENVITNYIFNHRGELIDESDTNGRINYAYDGMGRRIWSETHAASGELISWLYTYYNGNGEVEWIDGPRYNPEDYRLVQYDGSGRKHEETVWRTAANEAGTGVLAGGYGTTYYRHDYFGNLTDVIDPLGNTTTMTYTDIGQVETRKDALQQVEEFRYESGGLVSYHQDKLEGITETFYTDLGKPKKQTLPDAKTLVWRYYLDGRVKREPRDTDTYWTVEYQDSTRTTTKTLHGRTDAIIGTETVQYDSRGNIIKRIDLDGNVWETEYDGLNRLSKTSGPVATAQSLQHVTSYSYENSGATVTESKGGDQVVKTADKANRLKLVIYKNADGVVASTIEYKYSFDHNSVETICGSGDEAVTTRVTSNTAGKPVLLHDGQGLIVQTFDACENLIKVKDLRGRLTRHSYDALNRLKTTRLPDENLIELEYDGDGNMKLREMPGGLTWSADYDSAGRKLWEKMTGGADTTRYFSYDYYQSGVNQGRLEKVTTPLSGVQTYDYDDFGRVKTVTATGGNDSGLKSLEYKKVGSLKKITTSSSLAPTSTVERAVDGYGQILTEKVTLGEMLVSNVAQNWDAVGRRTGLSGPGSFDFDYRGDGLIKNVSMGTTSFDFGYTSAGLLETRSGLGLFQEIKERDGAGRIYKQETSIGSTTVLSEEIPRYEDGAISSYTAVRAGAAIADESRSYDYNSRGQIEHETFAPAAGESSTLTFSFDPQGRGIRSKVELENEILRNATTIDDFARVRNEASKGGPRDITVTGTALGASSVEVSIDDEPFGPAAFSGWNGNGEWSVFLGKLAAGNHTAQAKATHPSGYVASDVSNFTVQGAPESISYSYDQEGNLSTAVATSTKTLSWDWMGRLARVVDDASQNGFVWTAAYDGLGRRLRVTYQKSTEGALTGQQRITYSTYDPQCEFLEIAAKVGSSTAIKLYGPDLNGRYGGLQGIGGLQAVVGTSTVAIINDVFGNSVGMKNGSSVDWKAANVGAYGVLPGSIASVAKTADKIASATLWRGKRIDETGFYWLGARYYDPAGGRFISADPVGHAASLSLYDYANGDPVNFCDPDGRFGTGVVKSFTNQGINVTDSRAVQTGYNFGTVSEGFTSSIGNTISESISPYTQYASNLNNASLVVGTNALQTVNGVLDLADNFGGKQIFGSLGVRGFLESEGMRFSPTAYRGSNVTTNVAESAPRVFWSGGEATMNAAADFAKANGGMTLEMTAAGQRLTQTTKGLDWLTEAKPMWESASANFARGASGDVHIFQNSTRGVSLESIWRGTEYPILQQQGNNMIYHIVTPNGVITLP